MLCPSCGRDDPSDAQFCNECGANLDTPVAESPTPSEKTVSLTPSSFVGRQREMASLKAALEDALFGRSRLVMLAGEPGIGKTRMAQELASHAETLGAQVLWGRCYEEEGTPPYWPWLQSLRSYIQQRDPEKLLSEMGPGAADIAEIVPELGEQLPNLETPPALEPEQARFRLLDSITTFLKNAAQSQPLMLVLDDLHWADRSSLLLLEFLAREIQSSPLIVLGAYRDVEVSRRHPLSQTLGSLIREQRFLRVQLSGLAEPEVEELIRKTGPVRPPPGLSATIHRRTEGNPLFVTEIIRTLPGEGLEEGQDYLTSIPEGVRDAIGRRLNLLSEGCNQALTVASVIGREFDFRLISALMDDLTEASLLELVDEALAAHVIEEVSRGEERYHFSHALIQETLSEELSTSRKVRLHALIGESLEDLYGANTEAHAAELAHHFAEAEAVLGPDKLVRYSLLAGEQALATYAHEEALAHFERGLTAEQVPLSGTEPAKDEATAKLLFGLGRARVATLPRNQMQEAIDTLSRAFEYYEKSEDVERAVAVAETPIAGFGFGHPTGLGQIIERALALVPPESHQAGRLLSRYGRVLGMEEGNCDGADAALAQALVIARRDGDTTLESRILITAANVDIFHLRPQEGLEKALRAIDLASHAGDVAIEVPARHWASGAMLLLGDLEGLQQQSRHLLLSAERLRDRYWLASALWRNENGSALKGDFQEARDFSDRGLSVSATDHRLLATRVLLEYQVGESEHRLAHLGRLLEVVRLSTGPTAANGKTAIILPLVVRITGQPDLLIPAQAIAETILSSPAVTPLIALEARNGLALLAVQRDDSDLAREEHNIIEPILRNFPIRLISTDRLLGLLAHTIGDLDQAMTHFEDALTYCRGAGYRPELAWTSCDYADTLRQRNNGNDHERAMSLLDESLAIATELGMLPLMERVVVRQERAESEPGRMPAYPDGLTQREVEVLCLIAAGKTDRDIAEELVIAESTVRRHVSNIYAKIGTSNRAEATRYALRENLLSIEDA